MEIICVRNDESEKKKEKKKCEKQSSYEYNKLE